MKNAILGDAAVDAATQRGLALVSKHWAVYQCQTLKHPQIEELNYLEFNPCSMHVPVRHPEDKDFVLVGRLDMDTGKIVQLSVFKVKLQHTIKITKTMEVAAINDLHATDMAEAEMEWTIYSTNEAEDETEVVDVETVETPGDADTGGSAPDA